MTTKMTAKTDERPDNRHMLRQRIEKQEDDWRTQARQAINGGNVEDHEDTDEDAAKS